MTVSCMAHSLVVYDCIQDWQLNVRDGFCGKIHTRKHTVLLLSCDCLRFWELIGSFRLSMSRRKVISLSPSWSLIQREYYVLLANTSKHKTVSYLGKRDHIYLMFPVLSDTVVSSVLDQWLVKVWIELIFPLKWEGLPHLTPLQHWILIQST